MLRRLVRLAVLGDQHGIDPDARLASDMLPLINQIMTAARFPLRGAYPLIGKPMPDDEPHDATLRSAADAVERYRQCLIAIDADMIRDAAIAQVSFDAGEAELTLAPTPFVYQFIMPNMYFHVAMAYAILRAQGVALSKGDFDGLHAYTPGFSFV